MAYSLSSNQQKYVIWWRFASYDDLISCRGYFEQNLKLCKTCRKVPVPESFFNLQPATLLKKDTGICISLWKLAQYFSKNFIMENLLRTGFERRILQKMPKWHSYYKEILYRRQLFQKTDILRESSGRASSQKLCLMIS